MQERTATPRARGPQRRQAALNAVYVLMCPKLAAEPAEENRPDASTENPNLNQRLPMQCKCSLGTKPENLA
jgi:hypothetical protein